jgi:hypothetical protein
MGQLALKMALSLIAIGGENGGQEEELSNIVVQGRLIVRASTVGAYRKEDHNHKEG